jgi:hypothetical protein
MFASFFVTAAVSPTRQRSFRWAVGCHLSLLLACSWWGSHHPQTAGAVLGSILLTAGIVEGAVLIGWRLTQLPKSQALEFLLVSPLRPAGVFLGEALVGVFLLTLVTLAGLPILLLLACAGLVEGIDLLPLLLMPLTWGIVAGIGLTAWSYEPAGVRRWAERCSLALVAIYLVVGVAAGENLLRWIRWLPPELANLLLDSMAASHHYNPFSMLHAWMSVGARYTYEPAIMVEMASLALAGALLARAACRLRGHFHERHYRPARDRQRTRQGVPGDHPLSWWAVRRVTEYSGGFNLWLAGGFSIAYALYTVAGPHWPSWLGRRVFTIFDDAGGVPLWATAVAVLAAVPAAFQYGLWDSNSQERCRRLELLLLTRLTGIDYWRAACAAAWKRGRGYFLAALLLWTAQAVSGPAGILAGVAAVATGVLLWGLYFALGFWAFSRGLQANHLGLGLTIGLPFLTYGLWQLGWSGAAALLPPGSVYFAAGAPPSLGWVLGALLTAFIALVAAHHSRSRCDLLLRTWYDRNQGSLVLS